MKTIIPKTAGNQISIPTASLMFSDLDNRDLELYIQHNAMLLLPKQMTAWELIQALESVQEVGSLLLTSLSQACGECDQCSELEKECIFMESDNISEVQIPQWAREESGISADAKLTCYAVEDAGEVRVCPAQFKHDLADLHPDLIQTLKGIGICLGELDEHLKKEDTVYGS